MRVPIRGYEGLYEIDETGKVYTTKRQGSAGGEMKAKPSTGGYARIALCKDGKHTTFLLHRLVADAFVQNPNKEICVNHKDGNKGNNNASNLEWCSYEENMQHAVKHGLARVPLLKGDQHPMRKITSADASAIRQLYSEGRTMAEIGKRYGITGCQVSNIINGRHWKELPVLFVDIGGSEDGK